MGILDKVMFWKKKDEFADIGLGDKENLAFGDKFGAGGQPGAPGGIPPGLGDVPGGSPPGLGSTPGLGSDPMSQGLGQQPAPSIPQPSPPPPQFSQPPPPPSYDNPQQEIESKNLEIISSKLDAIRASLESLNQRLANLEAIARGDEEQSRKRRYY